MPSTPTYLIFHLDQLAGVYDDRLLRALLDAVCEDLPR